MFAGTACFFVACSPLVLKRRRKKEIGPDREKAICKKKESKTNYIDDAP